jgi:hypothetical protein
MSIAVCVKRRPFWFYLRLFVVYAPSFPGKPDNASPTCVWFWRYVSLQWEQRLDEPTTHTQRAWVDGFEARTAQPSLGRQLRELELGARLPEM